MTFKVGDRVIRRPGFRHAGRWATVISSQEDSNRTLTVRFDDDGKVWSGYSDRFELIGEQDPYEVDE